MTRINILLSLFLLLLILISSVLVLRELHHNLPTLSLAPLDAYMDQVTLKDYNPDGTLKAAIIAARMKHFKRESRYLFTTVNLHLTNTKREQWHIHAQHGEQLTLKQQILLWGNVLVQKIPTKQTDNLLISTSRLCYSSKNGIATSKQLITVTQPQLVLHGQGLHADLTHGIYTLLSKVVGHYEPSQQH